jgi:hypothetical protein
MFVNQVALQSCVLYFCLYTAHIYAYHGPMQNLEMVPDYLSRDFMCTTLDGPCDMPTSIP